MSFQEFCDLNKNNDNQLISTESTVVIEYNNSSGEVFSVNPNDVFKFLNYLYKNYESFVAEWNKVPSKKTQFTSYEEKSYRAIYKFSGQIDELKTIATAGKSQTKALTMVIAKLICFFSGNNYSSVEENTFFDKESIVKLLSLENTFYSTLIGENVHFKCDNIQKNKFKYWLRSKGLSERSIYSYADTSINAIDSLLSRKVEKFPGIYSCRSNKELAEFSTLLDTTDEWKDKNSNGNGMYQAAVNHYVKYLNSLRRISKSFVLLAGISGTGKSRFVRKQVEASGIIGENYKLVSVRPDWHEPSDLLGYISRISGVEKYVVTDTLKFMVSAWRDACDLNDTTETTLANKAPLEMNTFWLCLDEMNLAPVEQYFADYLSVIETREWQGDTYSCDPLLKSDVINLLGGAAKQKLRSELGLEDAEYDPLWNYFSNVGIPLPPNLIVAGTVNMDETTHGFSRKVIDRALTLDFGQFFPNDFDEFFKPKSNPVIFTFPTVSHAGEADLRGVIADPYGQKSLEFLKSVNEILKGTMFELAYRALNELLISIICINPKNDAELQSVWDDFLMTKVLPRIEGDDDKLRCHSGSANQNILSALDGCIKNAFSAIYERDDRPDFFRTAADGDKPVNIACRSKQKLAWMSARLERNGFTAFWP